MVLWGRQVLEVMLAHQDRPVLEVLKVRKVIWDVVVREVLWDAVALKDKLVVLVPEVTLVQLVLLAQKDHPE